jgi:hypothetical protein
MAKDKKTDLSKLLGEKLPVRKEEAPDPIDLAVRAIHSPAGKKEKLRRLTIDMSPELHLDVKRRALEAGITMRDYFILLAERDLGKR